MPKTNLDILIEAIKNSPELENLLLDKIFKQNEINYSCTICSHSFTSSKVKKSCPKCKKRKLIAVSGIVHDAENTPALPLPPAISPKEHKPLPEGVKKNRSGRIRPIEVGTNQFVDDGSQCKNDKEFDAKYGKYFSASERTRPANPEKTVVCFSCKQPFSISANLVKHDSDYYICNGCGSHRR